MNIEYVDIVIVDFLSSIQVANYVHYNDYRVATLSDSLLTFTGIIMQSLKLIEQF